MLQIDVDSTPPLENVIEWLDGIEGAVTQDLKPFWDNEATPLVAEEIARIFATEGYGTWAPLSGRYAAWKSRIFPGRTILRLRNNYFKASTIKGAHGNLYRADKNSMVWGVDLNVFRASFGSPYPIYHESGSARTRLPARPVYALAARSRLLQDKLIVTYTRWVRSAIDRETQKVFG